MTFKEYYGLKEGQKVRLDWAIYKANVYGTFVKRNGRKNSYSRALVEFTPPDKTEPVQDWFTFKDLRAN